MGAEPKTLQKLQFLDKEVLLVKVPPELGKVWTEACQRSLTCTNVASEDAHRELGSMTLRQAPPPGEVLPEDDEKIVQLKQIGDLSINADWRRAGLAECGLVDAGGADGDQTATLLFAVDTTSSAKRPRVEGRVGRNMRVKVDEVQQMELLKIRNAAVAPGPVRRITMIDAGHKEKSAVAAHRSAKQANAAQAKLMPISTGVKRPKVDKEGLEKFLFMCFEREKHWHFKDLVKETKQSAPKLKEVLNEIAEKVKQGRFKDMYQLRRDLQDVNDA